MTEMSTDVLVAVYSDIDAASTDFDGLMQLVESKSVEIEGAILVSHGSRPTSRQQPRHCRRATCA